MLVIASWVDDLILSDLCSILKKVILVRRASSILHLSQRQGKNHQYGFRPEKLFIDQIFTMRMNLEKIHETRIVNDSSFLNWKRDAAMSELSIPNLSVPEQSRTERKDHSKTCDNKCGFK